ncbi:MAG: class I SAM-dependent methyltransferase [Pirellulaceae bacterium]
MHRKIWEWCYIAQALAERQLLRPGRRGLVFAVGQEPLPALFAGLGCDILATDLDVRRAAAAGWVKTNQHADSLAQLVRPELCPLEKFHERVSFRHVDMNQIPDDLQGFDFVWSSCSLEHLGSLAHGEQFLYNSLKCLRTGGVAVHTTEFNVTSNESTPDYRSTVLYRARDIERIAHNLAACGHTPAQVDLRPGEMPLDRIVDVPPYVWSPHLKLHYRHNICTSVGLIVEKRSDAIPVAPRFVTPRPLRAVLRPWARWLKERVVLRLPARPQRPAA